MDDFTEVELEAADNALFLKSYVNFRDQRNKIRDEINALRDQSKTNEIVLLILLAKTQEDRMNLLFNTWPTGGQQTRH